MYGKTALLTRIKQSQDIEIEMESQVEVNLEVNMCVSVCGDTEEAGWGSTGEVERDREKVRMIPQSYSAEIHFLQAVSIYLQPIQMQTHQSIKLPVSLAELW